MKWTKITLETTTEAEDLVGMMLTELGIEGYEISDRQPLSEEDIKQMFVDLPPEQGEDDGIAHISFYVDSSEDTDTIIDKVKKGFEELSRYVSVGSGKISISETEDKDWINNWKEFFKPFRVDDNIIIKPSWESLEDVTEKDLVIELDPGTAFGTGSHETTKLCIIAIKKYINQDTVMLDAGSGSGILSIIARKLGAKEVLGIDIDPVATATAIENAMANGLDLNDVSLSFMTGNIIEDSGIRSQIGKEKYDVVVANILADVIIPLSAVIGENLKKGGIFISSGIIDSKEEAVKNALITNGFNILETNRMGEWLCFIARK
ncbi:MAG: 50S ribosomal protein L11 methyltransferase [Clostridiales bacterium]|nr:50S ribosomal protein L11 methyltransferase [Clostridiales bacterium]